MALDYLAQKAMIEDLLERDCQELITLFHGARNEQELYYANKFRDYEKEYKNFRYIPVLSNKDLETWSGERGHLDEVAVKMYNNDFSGHKAYLCGPPAMLDSCITALMRGRLYERDIHIEKFFSKADLNSNSKKSPLFRSL